MRVKAVVALTTLGMALAACGGSDSPETDNAAAPVGSTVGTDTAAAPSASTGTPAPPPHWPFTGLPSPQGLPHRRALIVKVDNTANAAPQVGLSGADLVTEELVEGGLTRLAAFYYSRIPETVGPVRSVRTSDIGSVLPVTAMLVASGGAPPVRARLQRVHIMTGFPDDVPGFFRASDRTSPYNLLLHPREVNGSLKPTQPPTDYLPWATGSKPTFAGQRVTGVSAVFSSSHTTTWKYQVGVGWIRTNGEDADGDRFTPQNLVVIQVKLQQAAYVDPSGAPVPETVLTGSGQAVVVSGDHAVTGRWRKGTRASDFHLMDQHGHRLAVPPGKTWIELVPISGSVQLSH